MVPRPLLPPSFAGSFGMPSPFFATAQPAARLWQPVPMVVAAAPPPPPPTSIDPKLQSPTLALSLLPFLDNIRNLLPPNFAPALAEKRRALAAGNLPDQLHAVVALQAMLAQFPMAADFNRLVHAWPLWPQYAPLLHQEMLFGGGRG
jgi:hypothetical protein